MAMVDTPAILGGQPLFPSGPPTWPIATPAVRDALLGVLGDGTWGKYDGGNVHRLEEQLGRWLGRAHALPVGSGTHGLDLALRSLGVVQGDGIVLCDYDYPGNFLTVHHLGARPVLVDIDPSDGQMSSQSLEEALATSAPGTIKAVVLSPVHGGLPDYDRIAALCEKASVPLIEDACQAVGGSWKGRFCGSFGAISLWSFGGSKLLSAGRGGMVFTDDARLHQRMKMANTRGSLVAPLSELQAAAILGQLTDFVPRHAQRNQAARDLDRLVGMVPFVSLPRSGDSTAEPGWYKWDLFWDEERSGLPVALLIQALQKEGIAADLGFRSLHAARSPSRYLKPVSLDQSHRLTARRIVIHHPALLEVDGPTRIGAAFDRIIAHRNSIIERLAGPGNPGA